MLHYHKAAKPNQPEAFLTIAHIHFYEMGKATDLMQAYQYYQMASNYNLPQADYHLGLLNEKGLGTSVDLDTAKDYYQRSADQGNTDAKIALDNLPVKEPEDFEIAMND